MYKLISILIGSVLFVLLFVVPLAYSIIKGGTDKSFKLTWIIWAVVLAVFGLSMPYIVHLSEKAGYAPADSDGTAMGIGILFGWLPGLLFAWIGKWINYWYTMFMMKRRFQEDIVVDEK